ncbi:Dicer-like protein 2 [Puttea exsequens]|nr:Dicer-like protein 2 [Puttea exsequens]
MAAQEQPRAYQLEMLNESMHKNIIVAAETGSGKTLIAILRMQAELEQCSADKLVWFCVPTVALAEQQYNAISRRLPMFPIRVLSGADNVHFWTNQHIWDEILKGIRIIVSTHQVLLETIMHGFVPIQRLALLVFDEAHSCIGNHPSSRLLRDFYHPASEINRPSILGLTASPVVNGKAGNLEMLESNLNAISRTPRLHREEMLKYVHPPKMIKLDYPATESSTQPSLALRSLGHVFKGLVIDEDPWIKKTRSNPKWPESNALHKALASHKTRCHEEIKGLYNKAIILFEELGPAAADYYIHQCIQKFQRGAETGSFVVEGLENEERRYLCKKFAQVHACHDNLADHDCLTPKVRTLIAFLKSKESTAFSGLIFVRTRAEVAVLSHILSVLVPFFAISTFVGASSFSGKRATIAELADVKNQKNTLDDLRYGRKNLIVTTNALEEGIDVAKCNVVVCFDRPQNLKSFIQRRGRARDDHSTYAIMFENGEIKSNAISTWSDLEVEMRKIYEDEMRELEEMKALEAIEENGKRELCNMTTGAKFMFDDAVQHLNHFCATLPSVPYMDRSPIYSFEDHIIINSGTSKLVSAKVMLPNTVDASVREAFGIARWRTENMAKRDAAFEAYAALYNAGLINDNFLPLGHIDEEIDQAYAAIEKRSRLVEVSAQYNAWFSVAQEWQKSAPVTNSLVSITEKGKPIVAMLMILPGLINLVDGFDLHWSPDVAYKVTVVPFSRDVVFVESETAARATELMLRAVFPSKLDKERRDFAAFFVPNGVADLQEWILTQTGAVTACDDSMNIQPGLVRDLSDNGLPHIFRRAIYASNGDLSGENMEAHGDDHLEHSIVIEATRLPKKVDYLHRFPEQDIKFERQSKPKLLSAKMCEIDKLPYQYSLFASFIPSIMHKVQIAMVVERLCNTVLAPLQFNDRGLVAAAISAPSAREATDYNRLEFRGDSCLKFFASLVLTAQHLNWHEGILSHEKDHIVSNNSLATAAVQKGLDAFILTKAFTGNKWRPIYVGQILENHTDQRREMSSKTLADVVEALIGAAYVDGGVGKALTCLGIFLPDAPWTTALQAVDILQPGYNVNFNVPPHLSNIEKLISYKFNLKALLIEALTHPSHHGPNSGASYQRLEFLGDAVLDNIVTSTAFAHEPPIATHDLHLVRAALVNRHYLGLCCLTACTHITRVDPVTDDPENITTIESSVPIHLWQAMRHTSPAVSDAQQACLARFKTVQARIVDAIDGGNAYPWTLLNRLEPPKFFSDIVESLLGAIYIDSHGSLAQCQDFLEHLGLMPYLRRVIGDGVALLHPKQELGQLSNQNTVEYVLGREGERLTCAVKFGDREIVRVGDGLSVMEVQTRAADEACRIVKEEIEEAKTSGVGDFQRERTHMYDLGDSDDSMKSVDEDMDKEIGEENTSELNSDEYATAGE